MLADLPPGLARIRELNQQLSRLMEDPQPGLVTWRTLLSQTLEELAIYCGTEVAPFASEVRAKRKQ